MDDYKAWLKKTLAVHAEKRDEASDNYQDTGAPRYYALQIEHEYYADALDAALQMLSKTDEGYAAVKRTLTGIYGEAQGYADSMPPQEALDRILSALHLASL